MSRTNAFSVKSSQTQLEKENFVVNPFDESASDIEVVDDEN